jgi:hypothetical protein
MSKPILNANYDTGEGSVSVKQEWMDLPPLLRADLLKDWMFDLNLMYESAVKQAFHRGEVTLEETNERV